MPGDRVALEPGTPCNICPLCKAGRYNLCADMKFAATPPYDGTLTRFYVLPEDMCVRLPAHVSLEEGALVEPLSVAMHACRGRVNFGDSVVVFGAGTIGLLVSAVAARAFGARKVVIVDINAKRVEFAREFVGGVAMGVESKELDVRGVVDEVLGNLDSGNFMAGADVAVEATGAESCIQSAVGVVRRGGTIVQVGMGQNIVSYPISEMATKEVQMRGSFRYSAGDYVLAVQLISEGKVDVKKLVTGRYKFKDSEKAFEETKRGTGIKVLIMGPDSVIQ
jgi:D-xylulose reductase